MTFMVARNLQTHDVHNTSTMFNNSPKSDSYVVNIGTKSPHSARTLRGDDWNKKTLMVTQCEGSSGDHPIHDISEESRV